MNAQHEWSRIIKATDLTPHLDNGGLYDFLSDEPAVYMWSRKISPSNSKIATSSKFREWLSDASNIPHGKVRDNLRHFGVAEIQIGGAGTPSKITSELAGFSQTLEDRRRFSHWLRALDYISVLYVGEAENLGRRIEDHLKGRTGFSERIRDLGYSWAELGLRYLALPAGISPQTRKAMEYMFAALLLAPATSRAG